MKEAEKSDDKKEKKTDKPEEEVPSGSGFTWILIGVIIVIVALIVYNYKDLTGNVALNSGNMIKIGFMGPLTGDAAVYGQSIKQGVELAEKEANLENVEIIYEDSGCDPTEAVNSVNKLIDVDGVQAIVGEVCSGATLAAAPIAESKNVVMISPSSTSPKISEAGDYIFRTVPSDALQGAFAADLIYQKGFRRVAVLYGNEEYGVGFDKVFEKNFRGNITGRESFERGSTDIRTQITKIRSSRPDAILIVSNSPESSVAALKQIRQLGVSAALFGSEGLKTPEVANVTQAQGLIITSVSSGSVEFNSKFIEEYDEAPGAFAAQGYDSFAALARTIKQGARTGTEIKNALYVVGFDGASGRISFDLNGDISGNYEVYQLKKGEWIRI